MTMEKINVTISEKAKDIVVAYKTAGKWKNMDSALDALLLEFEDIHIR